MQHRFDSIIIGGGLVGMSLACAMAAHGLEVALVDTMPPETALSPHFDGRASAINSSSLRMFGAIGVRAGLEGYGAAIDKIRVLDRTQRNHLLFDATDSGEGSGAGEPLGYMFENRRLRLALNQACDASALIHRFAPAQIVEQLRDSQSARVTLADGRLLHAPLLIAADGRRSTTREAAGITLTQWDYGHSAMITTVAHAQPHDFTAYEIFYDHGPFAILPMLDDDQGRHRSAIVWTVARQDAAAWAALSDRAKAHEIEKRMQSMLGPIAVIAPFTTYPLGFQHATKLSAERLLLVGDAAHGIHPIAGQGLNLGLRDVAALAQVLAESARLGLDLGDAQVLDRYVRWRGLDTMMVSAATDVLTRIFGVRQGLFSRLRGRGVALVDKIAPLKRVLMAEARGESGELPLLLRGELA